MGWRMGLAARARSGEVGRGAAVVDAGAALAAFGWRWGRVGVGEGGSEAGVLEIVNGVVIVSSY